jgi:hypothetical protein
VEKSLLAVPRTEPGYSGPACSHVDPVKIFQIQVLFDTPSSILWQWIASCSDTDLQAIAAYSEFVIYLHFLHFHLNSHCNFIRMVEM